MKKVLMFLMAVSLLSFFGCEAKKATTKAQPTPALHLDAQTGVAASVSGTPLTDFGITGVFAGSISAYALSYEPTGDLHTYQGDPASGTMPFSRVSWVNGVTRKLIQQGDIVDVASWGTDPRAASFDTTYFEGMSTFNMDIVTLRLTSIGLLHKEDVASPDVPQNYTLYGDSVMLCFNLDLLSDYPQFTVPTVNSMNDPLYRVGTPRSINDATYGSMPLNDMYIMFINKNLVPDLTGETLTSVIAYPSNGQWVVTMTNVSNTGATHDLFVKLGTTGYLTVTSQIIIIPYDVKSVAMGLGTADHTTVFENPIVSIKFDLSNALSATSTMAGRGTLADASGRVTVRSDVAHGQAPFNLQLVVSEGDPLTVQ